MWSSSACTGSSPWRTLSVWCAPLMAPVRGPAACQVLVYPRTPGHLSATHKHGAKSLLLGCHTPQNDLPGCFCKNGNTYKWGRYCAPGYLVHLSSIPQINPAPAGKHYELWQEHRVASWRAPVPASPPEWFGGWAFWIWDWLLNINSWIKT